MVFSNLVFLFVFLPAVLFVYYLVDKRLKNLVLLFFSLLFYAWGEPKLVLLMLLSIGMNYIFGILIDEQKMDDKKRQFWLTLSIIANVGILFYFKYIGFLIDTVNGSFDLDLSIGEVALPIGISFYTFQAMSYLIDVYRRDVAAQRNLMDLALYIALFPQLVAGPIVRYQLIASELKNRTIDVNSLVEGIKIFIIGLAKKVLIANQMAVIADEIFSRNTAESSIPLLWIGVIAYALQIYFDFSGYSQMAIGLGRMFGFHFPANFNYPYISTSISEFWRRWHITLGSWFRDYVYIPLGGNRVAPWRLYLNLTIVWFLTGLWHGANWTFVMWGLYFGFIISLERAFLGKWLLKWWRPFRHLYVILIVLLSWVLFRSDTFSYSVDYILSMVGLGESVWWSLETNRILHDNWLVFTAGIVFSMPVFKWLQQRTQLKLNAYTESAVSFIYLILFLICVMMLVNSTYNPFIYFRF